MPTPRQVRYIPHCLCRATSFSSSSSEVSPTLKSPSVARITLLLPPVMNCDLATRYAARMPASPGVGPPGERSSMDFCIFFLSAPEVGGSQTPTVLPYTTMETVSMSRRLFTSRENADFNSGSLLGRSMDPDTSMRKTRLAGGILAGSSFRAQTFTNSSWSSAFQGHSDKTLRMEKQLSLGGSL